MYIPKEIAEKIEQIGKLQFEVSEYLDNNCDLYCGQYDNCYISDCPMDADVISETERDWHKEYTQYGIHYFRIENTDKFVAVPYTALRLGE